MLVTATFFAVRLSRVDLVASTFTSRDRRSSKARPLPDQAILSNEGDRVQAFQLRGYIFFGSAYRLVARLRRVLGKEPRPACVLLDFSSVTGFDLSALNSLCSSSSKPALPACKWHLARHPVVAGWIAP